MPGSQRNGWMSYLNGGTAQYNFSYTKGESEQSEPALIAPTPQQPTPLEKKKNVNMPPPPISEPINKKQTGGKRKTRRHTKKRRHSRRK